MAQYRMDDYIAKAREAAGEGVVLLENRGNVLPLAAGTRIALFGRSQFHYYKSGAGSGGLVNASYVTGIKEAIEADGELILNKEVEAAYEVWLKDHPFDAGSGWASEPWHQEEMPISDELLHAAKALSDAAVVIIGRTAGEDQDNSAAPGSYYLTEREEELLQKVCGAFEKTVVLLNVGNIIDMNWADRYHPAAVAYVWQGGQEGGDGVLDILKGTVTPSGKLPDTIACDIYDIPSTEGFGNPDRAVYEEDIYVGYRYFETFAKERVRYPFGYGLSYTTFSIRAKVSAKVTDRAGAKDGAAATYVRGMRDFAFVNPVQEAAMDSAVAGAELTVTAVVRNTGKVAGKEVVQVYAEAPQGKLGKAARSLCGFAKTNTLAPGKSEELRIRVSGYRFASYDSEGVTGHKSCYVLEAGTYRFYVGSDVRSAALAGELVIPELIVLVQLEEALAPTECFPVLKPDERTAPDGNYKTRYIDVPERTVDPVKRMEENFPEEAPQSGDLGITLRNVAAGDNTMYEFIGQFTDEDLTAISRGEGMCSPKVTPGIAGAFGGVTEHLKAMGLPVAGCSDGPSGIRMDCGTRAFSMPNGTLLASTFNLQLCEELYEWEGLELRKNRIDMLLGPGMNIHRNPLNGRNFEYFSEDPLLTGEMAAAQLRGLHRHGVTGTIKHFAANDQETNRHGVEAVVSERALREIYLKGFEIAVRKGHAHTIMSSYNPINGFWTASNYDLLTIILRNEWGYRGIVMTDWWAKGNFAGEKGDVANTAAKALAQNDVNMVCPDASDDDADNSMECLESGRVPRSVYQRNAANICRVLMRTPAYERMVLGRDTMEEKLKDLVFEGEDPVSKSLVVSTEETDMAVIPGEELDTARGACNLVTLQLRERGLYRIEVVCRARAEEGELSQIPLTVSLDKAMIGTITLQGTQKEWETYTFDDLNPFISNNCYLKFYFGQAGMEVREIRVILKMSLEERIREAMAQMGVT